MSNSGVGHDLVKWIEVDRGGLVQNARAIRRELIPPSKFLAIVKTNAYGHGLKEVSRALMESGVCDALGVWSLQEASQLWKMSWRRRPQVMVLAPAPIKSQAIVQAVREGAWLVADNPELLRVYIQAASSAGKNARVFLDLDLGLGRWGSLPRAAFLLARRLLRSSRLSLMGITTHIDYVPGLNKTEAALKLEQFLDVATSIERLAGRSLIKTCANSSVFLDFPSWRLDLARVGNLLYGINQTQTPLAVKSIWNFKARILRVRSLAAGETVGYGSEYVAPRAMRIASIACGFADGLTMEPAGRAIRLASPGHYYARSGSRRFPIIGRVGLGHAILNVSSDSRVRPGDIVTLPVRRTAAPMDVPRIYC